MSNSLVKALKEVLGNVFSMYVRTHGAHWNVRGSDFAQYHELFETIYEDVYGSIDPLAENIRKLDADAPSSLADFNEFDGLSEAPVSGDSEQVLTQDILDANRIVLESLDKAFEIANDDNEQGIANFLAERIDMHQKWKWQLTSSLEKKSSVKCAACGEDEACFGHAIDVDPVGYAVIANHKVDDHLSCHPAGCKVAGRSVHAHSCMNCGEQAVCTSKVANASCEERNTICANCLPKLARIDHLAKGGVKERMRMHTNGGEYDNVSDELIAQAIAEGRTIDSIRKTHGPHRPTEASVEIEASFEIEASEDSGDSFVPPSSVASAAKRGLSLRKKYNRGGTEIGVARARDLSNRKGLSYSTVKRMKAYFDRHEVDKKGKGWGKNSAGYIAWLLWGGDSGRSWANKIIKQHEKKSTVSINETVLPEWLKQVIAEDAEVIDFTRYRRDRGRLTPEEVEEIATETAEEAHMRLRGPKKQRKEEPSPEATLTPGYFEGVDPLTTEPEE